MQGKLAAPRERLTVAQVDELLTGQGVRRGFGLELWDADAGGWVDISPDCKGFTVSHDNTGEVHWTLSVKLARELPWGTARVRPYRVLSKNGVTARFYRGVYVLLTPVTNRGRTPLLFDVDGHDLNQRLLRLVGDTLVIEANGTLTYFEALRDVLGLAGLGSTPRLDGTRQDTVIPRDLVWALGPSGGARWLDVANGILAQIAYIDLWHDHEGVPRSEPIKPLAERGPEWVFDTANKKTDLLGEDRQEEYDAWGAPNVWRGIARDWPTQPTLLPAPDGMVEVRNETDGESSIASLGFEVPAVHFLDVADQTTLAGELLRIVEADRRAERRFVVQSDPLPIAGHRDVVELRDGGRVFKVMVSSWQEHTPPAEGLEPKGTWVLGGGTGGASPERVEEQATATVTQASPLRVVLDGATVDCPAAVLDDDDPNTPVPTFDVGTRVTVTIRNPQPPLVQGKET